MCLFYLRAQRPARNKEKQIILNDDLMMGSRSRRCLRENTTIVSGTKPFLHHSRLHTQSGREEKGEGGRGNNGTRSSSSHTTPGQILLSSLPHGVWLLGLLGYCNEGQGHWAIRRRPRRRFCLFYLQYL